MSMPNVPDITPVIELERDEAITLLLASIALEEMGLAHILNVEGEKMQHVLSMLGGDKKSFAHEILAVNESVDRLIKSVTRLQIILQDKLESVARLIPKESNGPPCPDPKPPKPPKVSCKLVGCALGCVRNSEDDYYEATATLDAKGGCHAETSEPFPVKYTLFKRGKGRGISAVLVPICDTVEVQCSKKSGPCPTPQEPYVFSMKGKGIMCVKGIGEGTSQSTVHFTLNVWDYGVRQEFQMITRGSSNMYSHDSGIVDVTQGDLQIVMIRGNGNGCDV